MTRKSHVPALLALFLILAGGARAQEEITLIAPGGAKEALEAAIAGFEAKTGQKVNPTFGSGLGTKKQIAEGAVFDVPVAQPPFPEILASGNVDVKSRKPLASVAVALAVKAGAPKPDISTPEAVKALLQSAKSVTYPDPAGGAAAGVTFEEMLAKLGFDKKDPKFIPIKGGLIAMKAVADGKAEIGFTFASEMRVPGIDRVGTLPASISPPTVLVGFVSTHAKNPAGAKALLDYLSSPEAGAIYRAQGMEPAAQ